MNLIYLTIHAVKLIVLDIVKIVLNSCLNIKNKLRSVILVLAPILPLLDRIYDVLIN